MFGRKRCQRCNKKLSSDFVFCPNCGYKIKNDFFDGDWGMLGKDDFMPSIEEMSFPAGFDNLFGSLMKNLNKEFSEMSKKTGGKIKRETHRGPITKGLSINISFGPGIPVVKQTQKIKKEIKIPSDFSEENLKKLSKFPKEEPKTNIRRLANRIIYEIELPGVSSIKNISIARLENSMEIKALGKDRVYFKTISLNLPIVNYNFSDEKLVLELED